MKIRSQKNTRIGSVHVDATVWTYTFKRTTGMNTSPVKFANMPATGATDVEFSGYWVKFPLDAKQTSYEVFDATLRRTAPAVYKDSQEHIEDRKSVV